MGRITRTARVTRVTRPRAVATGDGSGVAKQLDVDTRADSLAVEEPLEIRVGGRTLASTMRTPGHDVELVHGFLHAEGLISAAEEVAAARYCAGTGPDGLNTYNVLDVSLADATPAPPEASFRNVAGNSSCGVCGTVAIDDVLARRAAPISPVRLDPELVMELPERLRAEQRAFKSTGGIHAAGLFTLEGEPLVIREDIGRHNAADKVIGNRLLAGELPAADTVLVMSSRASFELVQKAVLAGIPALVAVSAATSLAVDLARESGLFLTGFTRTDRFNLYSGELAAR